MQAGQQIQIPKNDEELNMMSDDDLLRLVYQLRTQANQITGTLLDLDVDAKKSLLASAQLDIDLHNKKATLAESHTRLLNNYEYRKAQFASATARRDLSFVSSQLEFYQAVLMNRKAQKGNSDAQGQG